jgi:hypothetical protein
MITNADVNFPLPVFIGWDSRETVAYHVLAHSIIRRARMPVSITPIGNELLPEFLWDRPRGEYDSTEFSNARFLVPALMNYEGWAVFMDCDMLCMADICELFDQADSKYAVMVRKHEMTVKLGSRKFLDQEQTAYSRKNWSSLMLINCAHPAWRHVNANDDDGLRMHRFEFLEHGEIGAIKGSWNELLAPGEYTGAQIAKLWHFTLGGPWHGWTRMNPAHRWSDEFSDMLSGNNPRAHVAAVVHADGMTVGGSYHVSGADALAEAEAFDEGENAA